MTEHGVLAEEFFKKGYNCSQSVVAAFTQELGISEEMALRLSCGFGGGVGRLREVCGAFSGLTIVISMLYANPADPDDKSKIYAIIQHLAEEFKKESGGSIICKELLGLVKPEGTPQAAARTNEYYQKRPCASLVSLAAELVDAYVAEHPLS